MSKFVSFNSVSFAYPAQTVLLLERVTFAFHGGWYGVIGANGAGKTTLLMLACGLLRPLDGSIEGNQWSLYLPQRTDLPPENFQDLLDSFDSRAYRLMLTMGVQLDWLERWSTLSHGERKRAQLAAALFRDPHILAVDEPTNHLDVDARKIIIDALLKYRGVGLIVVTIGNCWMPCAVIVCGLILPKSYYVQGIIPVCAKQ
ncbi:MAG: ABC-F family ATP-binding cassette domain-containing protein [Oligoflexia bacterium]|nr:ABC-F family ATP-binding cassette domain-containing protein [Oligoflexia bacterium]